MNKIGITILILATLGLGYWLSVAKFDEQQKSPEIENLNIFSKEENSQGKTDQTQNQTEQQMQQETQIQTQNENKIINNEEDNKKIMTATLHTNKGDIMIEFNPNTPNTVANFVKLAKDGFYDGTKFHRVIKGFMSQGGDPFSKDDTKMSSWGTGGPGYKFDDEITSDNKNDINTISMANAGPNSNGSQFFINAADNNYLDSKHTVFGKIVSGADVAKAINNVPTAAGDRPVDPVVIKSITLK
ncbi:MAG: peptidylprolyl isomerase [Burkholderiales bacterium]|nr:peptidylprolyl isomerase [Burkholderiales bacterium]